MNEKSKLILELGSFISERISDIENNDFYKTLTDAQKKDFFNLEYDCYLRGFIDGIIAESVA